jgi:hypothetical protein
MLDHQQRGPRGLALKGLAVLATTLNSVLLWINSFATICEIRQDCLGCTLESQMDFASGPSWASPSLSHTIACCFPGGCLPLMQISLKGTLAVTA